MKTYKIAVLAGDGIGPEIMEQALKVLHAVERRSDGGGGDGVRFETTAAPFGAVAWFECGKSLPDATIEICDAADAILKGTIGLSHEASKQIPPDEQPERGALLPLRKRYNTFANLRPLHLPRALAHFSPLKPDIIGDGIDIMMVRELVGGLYFGDKERGIDANGKRFVRETLEYDEEQVRRIVKVAFEAAMKRRKTLHNIHKSNVLLSSVLWNEVLEEVAPSYPEVEVHHLLVDAAATMLCLNPGRFDVMVMENMFGDILSDQGGGILGSLGLMPSACIGPEKSYYEPSHGSAPDIAGRGIANPYAMIGSLALMLELDFGLTVEATNIRTALQQVFTSGHSTPDLPIPNGHTINTREFGDRVVTTLEQMKPPPGNSS